MSKSKALDLFCGVILIGLFYSAPTLAQTVIYPAVKTNRMTEAKFGRPTNGSPDKAAPAVVILHHGGGCVSSQTPKYAEALNKAGYFTLEPCLFSRGNISARPRSTDHLPQVFGALRYLANTPGVDRNRIAITGGSYGGIVTFLAATQWAYDTHADISFPPFAAHAPFYPVCYLFDRFLSSRPDRADLPGHVYDQLTGAKIRIYAGGKDDYDSREPAACENMIKLFSPEGQKLISLKLFPDATHGWDHQNSESYHEPLACKGRGCTNFNIVNAATTQEGIEDLIDFFNRSMPR